jgi:preprotein translocase subunit SecE
VARKPRQQRRARRAQDAPADNGQTSPPKPKAAPAPASSSASARSQAKRAQVRPTQPVKSQTGSQRTERRRGRFIVESWGELKKVEWPGRNQVTQGTVVVIIACAVVGAYLYILDLGFARLVDAII